MCVFFFKQKTAYEMRISDWSSDVCSSDLRDRIERDCRGVRDIEAFHPRRNRQPREDVAMLHDIVAHPVALGAEDERDLAVVERFAQRRYGIAGQADTHILHLGDFP